MTYLTILPIIIGIVWITLYWKAAEIDNQPRTLWAGASLAVFMLTWWLLGWGWAGVTLAQILLAILIAILRTLLTLRQSPD
jgi:hypothetical protein